MPTERSRWPVLLAASLLLWPALWNQYPIVFADTGTYLSQAVHRYLGWDRPVFYSLFLLPLHATVTLWPVIVAQAGLTAWVLHLARRALAPACSAWWVVALAGALAAGSWLPWLVCEIMPDVFTPLLVLALCLLMFAPETLSRHERAGLCGLAAFMIATQQSSLPLSLVLLGAALPLRLWLRQRPGPASIAPAVAAPVLAIAALAAVNLAGHQRLSVSPYGNVFLLARIIHDGPGLAVLRRDCPDAGWRLCAFLDRFPATSDAFLWRADSPVILAGGHKLVSAEADAIITAALRTEPMTVLRAFLANAGEQLVRFRSGDGLDPWPAEVSPWIARDFPPAERARYAAARQQRGVLAVPDWLARVHGAVAAGGVVACLVLLPGALRRGAPCAGFMIVALLTLPVCAAITGGLSTPHDRYQSRVMWLPACVSALAAPSLLRRRA